MLKSICIKTNKDENITYILNELNNIRLDNVYFSCKKFKNYTNIIIHCKGKAISVFLSSLSKILTYLVLDLYENFILEKLISSEYFYFSIPEQKAILDICINALNYEDSVKRFKKIEESFFEYLNCNKAINLKGFINFRLSDYIEYLDYTIDICVNKFIIDKEYLEFINLLKSYVNTSRSTTSSVHLIYKNQESILLDEHKNIIPINKNAFNAPFLSDISFSSNDYTLNSLLSILPNKIYIHLLEKNDEFIDTLKLIFDGRVHMCNDCDICRMYKHSNIHNRLNK